MRPLVRAIMGSGQGAVMAKYALWLQGVIDAPAVRLPLVGVSDSEVEALRAALVAQGAL